MKTKILILSMVLSVMAISCSKDKNDDNTNITPEEASINSKVDIATDDVTGISEYQIDNANSNSFTYKSVIEQNPFAPSQCATVTRNPDFGITPQPGQLVTKTIDFGTTGCPLNNGNIVKGKIIISFNYNSPITNWTVTFDNFYHNNIKINGTKTYTRTFVGTPSHPKVTVNIDLTATLSDGRVFTRTGQRVREFTAGYGTPSTSDDEHTVTGSWTTTFPNTTTQTATITTPLLLKMSCISIQKPIIVQGVITYVRGSHTATLDFGDGTCDNIAIFTKNGVTVQIIIGN